jgi:hypothetical protein
MSILVASDADPTKKVRVRPDPVPQQVLEPGLYVMCLLHGSKKFVFLPLNLNGRIVGVGKVFFLSIYLLK